MRIVTAAVAALLAVPLAASTAGAAPPSPGGWEVSVVDEDQSFRGLDAVDRDTAWVTGGSVSGGPGAVYRTTDGGDTWEDVRPPGSEGLNFRDVEATDADTAVVLAIGEGEASRVYRTTDGGKTWTETFRNDEEAAFYNCIDFAPGGRVGLGVSDPVDGKFRIIRTTDGGASWRVLPSAGMPDSSGEANFSASGDCLTMTGRDAWFGSGGEDARVYQSSDHGLTWTAWDAAVPSGEAAGVFALDFSNPRHGLVLGGDFEDPSAGKSSSATRSGWSAGGDLTHLGEDVAWLKQGRATALAVGEGGGVGGTSLTRDGGRTWQRISDEPFHTLDCLSSGECWAAGGGGRVGRL